MPIKWSYKKAVEFIALNDEPEEKNIGIIEDMLSVITLSIASGKSTRQIAKDVYKLRRKGKII